ncbi:hypothetical protein FB45DRAFT_1040359 [Roridomyces roridus]|uniref:Uncharacterized protein n=1 Tax=Roridomyces roridus TaxID=1738132 RepID=A0AAD7FA05_9AGAR|nr:hypothetical protein FB45DRAFT_1040359 [Roridomyces roridus]
MLAAAVVAAAGRAHEALTLLREPRGVAERAAAVGDGGEDRIQSIVAEFVVGFAATVIEILVVRRSLPWREPPYEMLGVSVDALAWVSSRDRLTEESCLLAAGLRAGTQECEVVEMRHVADDVGSAEGVLV